MNYDPNNIFAKILKGELPSHKVYEDDHTLAFMDLMPQTPGHTLVIPKFPCKDIFDLDDSYLAPLLSSTRKVAKAVKLAFNSQGVMLFQLNGAAAGQTVFHLHFHIVPRQDGVDLSLHARAPAAQEELKENATKIRSALLEIS